MVKRVMCQFDLGLYMAVKLFGASWMRQTRTAQNILSGSNIAYTYVDVQQNPIMTQALDHILGEYSLPVLFVDGRAYKGVEKVREYIRTI